MRITLSPTSIEDYATFLRVKSLPKFRCIGRTVEFPDEYAGLVGMKKVKAKRTNYDPHPELFDYQRDIAGIAITKKKFAAFVAPGLGKTFIESEFARHASEHMAPNKRTLIITPLMVVPQMLEEIDTFYKGTLDVRQVKASELSEWLTSDGGGIGITNYEALKDDTPQGNLGALILDESSLLKSHYGKWGGTCIRLGKGLEWKLAATGTPAPNDRIEFANHAVFLDQFPTVNSFLAKFFVNRGETQNRWELKPHALRPFYLALSHWCIFLSNPETYGWKDNAGTLPPINVHIHNVPLSEQQHDLASSTTGTLFGEAGGITSRTTLAQIAKGSYRGVKVETSKPAYIKNLIDSWPGESTLVWCLYNKEQDTLEEILPDAASIRGDTPHEKRAEYIAAFKAGTLKILISKPEILGLGLNLQIATRQVFSGIQDSYEEYFQAVKRSNRVGSTLPLNVHIPITLIERPMLETVLGKAKRVEQDTAEQESLFKEFSKGVR